MLCQIFDRRGRPLRVEEREPECGDYCENCGDCLHCYGDEECFDSADGLHMWCVISDEDGEFVEE